MGRLNIAVAGCGPAGLAAALLLHRDGHRVALFERFDEPRPLGSGLMVQPTGLAVLDALGLGEATRAAGARVDRLLGQAADSGRTALDVRYSALGAHAGPAFGVHRATLFAVLHDAVRRAGPDLETGRTVMTCEAAGSGAALVFEGGRRAGPFDLVVDALGSNSPLAARSAGSLPYGAFWANLDWPSGAGFDEHALQQKYRAASVMAGVLPIGVPPGCANRQAAFFWSLRVDRPAEWRAEGLERWKSQALQLWPELEPLLGQIETPEQFTFARYAHQTLRRPVGPALVHVGDSWHSASPQLGQGANMALLDAYALALALRRAPDTSAALRVYVGLRGRHVWLYQAISALFTPVYQSESRALPWIRDRIVGPLARTWPSDVIQAAMVSGLIGAPLKRLDLEPCARPVGD